MVEVYKLTKRHLDGAKSGDSKVDQIKIFSDFSEKVLEIEESEYQRMVENGDDYLRFKIGNLSKYFEIEIFPEHAAKLLPYMVECPFKEILKGLNEGYLVLRKDFQSN